MRIQDTLANVTALVPQVEKIIATLKYTDRLNANLWREFLQECKDFIKVETNRLKELDTTIGANIARLLENDYKFGVDMLTSSKECLTAFFDYVAQKNVLESDQFIYCDGVSVYKGDNKYEGRIDNGKIVGLYYSDLIMESDWSKIYKKAASLLGLTKMFKVSSRKVYRGADVTFTSKGKGYADYNTLFGYISSCSLTFVYNQGYDKNYMTSNQASLN